MKKEPTNHQALLDRDVRAAFPDDESVNEALRVIVKAAETLTSQRPRIQREPKPVHQPRPAVKKRRKQSTQRQKACRVIVLSARGKIIYSTDELRSRPDLRKRILNHQRHRLKEKYPSLRTMRDAVYKLEWLVDGKWVVDKAV